MEEREAYKNPRTVSFQSSVVDTNHGRTGLQNTTRTHTREDTRLRIRWLCRPWSGLPQWREDVGEKKSETRHREPGPISHQADVSRPSFIRFYPPFSLLYHYFSPSPFSFIRSLISPSTFFLFFLSPSLFLFFTLSPSLSFCLAISFPLSANDGAAHGKPSTARASRRLLYVCVSYLLCPARQAPILCACVRACVYGGARVCM